MEGRPVSGAVRKFKCPLKKTQPFCPSSMVLNWTGEGLIIWTLLQHHGSYIHISMTQIWWPFNRTTCVCVCVCVCARARTRVCAYTHARTHCPSLKLYSISDRWMNAYGAFMELWQRKTTVLLEKPFLVHAVYHKSQKDYTGMKPKPPC